MSLFGDEWIWTTILAAVLVVVVPLLVVWFVIALPAEIRVVATIGIVVLWGVVSGYKDWVISKGHEAEKPTV